MNVQNSINPEATHHLLDDQFDALKAGVRKLIERVSNKPAPEMAEEAPAEPTRVRRYARSFAGKAMEMVSAHPIAATAFALGIGYVAVRIARR